MTTTKQTFPAVNIEALPNGLLRLEDETSMEGLMVIDLHPAQVQVLVSMTGFTMPDRVRKALDRLTRRLNGIRKQAEDLEGQLSYAVKEQDIGVAAELTAAEFIVHSLGELIQDFEAIQAPEVEPGSEVVNPGGQMTIPI